MFGLLKKNKQEYGIIKIFRTVTSEEAKNFKAFEVINFCMSKLLSSINAKITDVDLNFGEKEWKRHSSFIRFFESHPNHPVALLNSYIGDTLCGFLTFGNEKLMSIPPNRKIGIINLYISFPSKIMTIDFLKDFLYRLFQIEIFDYGYVCFLSDDYEIDSEKKLKKSLFSITTPAITSKDHEAWEQLVNIRKGYIKGIYPVNILNNSQIGTNKISNYLAQKTGVLHDVKNSDLKIWELREDEIEKLCFNK